MLIVLTVGRDSTRRQDAIAAKTNNRNAKKGDSRQIQGQTYQETASCDPLTINEKDKGVSGNTNEETTIKSFTRHRRTWQ